MEVDSRQERDERLRIFMKESNFTILLDPNKEIVMVQNKGMWTKTNVLIANNVLVLKLSFNCTFTTFFS